MIFTENELKKWTLKSQKSQITILLLNQCSISAVFPIVRFAGDQKTALTGESLYLPNLTLIPKQVQLKLVSEGLFDSLWDNHSFLYLKLFNCVYYFWGLSMSTSSKHFVNSLPVQANHKFGIKQIAFCTKSIKKVLYLTKTGSWRTSYGFPFFSTWVTPLLFTRLEVSKEYFKEYFQYPVKKCPPPPLIQLLQIESKKKGYEK